MNKLTFLFLGAVLFCTAANLSGDEPNVQEVRVATWNANAIFHRDGDALVRERGDEFRAFRDDLKPDVVLLQEVSAKRQVQTIKELLGLNYAVISDFFPDRYDYGSLEVAIISRFPLTNVTEYDFSVDNRDPSIREVKLIAARLNGIADVSEGRGFLTAEVAPFKALVAVTHLKSSRGRTDASDAQNAKKREYVASGIASVVADWISQNPDGTVVLGGDMNVAERDSKKNGKVLGEDRFHPASGDKYDETHALFSQGLVKGLKMRSLSRDLKNTYAGRDFGPIGPIDCLYVGGKHAGVFDAAVRAKKTYGSDHYAVIAKADLRRVVAPSAPPKPAPGAEVVRDTVSSTLWTQTSAEYVAIARQTYRLAALSLKPLQEDPFWSADLVQRAGGDFAHLPPAVILDVDETVLDNSPFEARLIRDKKTYTSEAWGEWVNEARAKAIPGAIEFIRHAQRLGVKVFFITNRRSERKMATHKNLEQLGIKATNDMVLTRGERPDWDGSKVQRRASVAQKYRIVMLIGDDLNDFTPMKKKEPQARKDIAFGQQALIGKGWILLPNAVYGSWMDKLPTDRLNALRTR